MKFRTTLAALACAVLVPVAAFAATPRWTYTTTDIAFQRVTSLGTLLVSSDDALRVINPADGSVLWERKDLAKFKECNFDELENTPYGMLDIGEGMGGTRRHVEVIDLQTGKTKWDSEKLPILSSTGQIQVAHKRMLVIFGLAKKGNKPMTVAVDTETGEIKWQQERLFEKPLQLFEVKGSGRMFKRMSIAGNQPATFPDENSMVVWLSEDGPIKINLETGAKEWACIGLKGKTPAAMNYGFCGMLSADGVIYVPYEKSLQAVSAKSGELLWKKEKDFRGRPCQMRIVQQGIVVRGASFMDGDKPKGKPFIDVLNPATGESVWKKPFKDLEDATSFDVDGDRVYICADNEMHAVALADGTDQIIAKFKFKEGEVPSSLSLRDGGFLLTSSQSLLKLSKSGKEEWRAYYPAPGQAGWIKVLSTVAVMTANAASAASAYDRAQRYGGTQTYYLSGNPELSRRFKATTAGVDFRYILTSVEDGGKKRPGLVKVAKSDGKIVSSVQLGDKTPEYEVDEVEGILYFKKSDGVIEAYAL